MGRTSSSRTTPMMEQYRRAKGRHRDAILMFRLGDFYEMFEEDALVASKALEITLTSRGKGTATEVPMCGVPVARVDHYIARLLRHGHKVAVCDQVEDAAGAKGLVDREVVRVITPGTDLDQGNLEAREPNYLAAVCPDGKRTGLAFLDPSTGEFQLVESDGTGAGEALARFLPREVLYPEGAVEGVERVLAAAGLERVSRTPLEGWLFATEEAGRTLREHLGVVSLEGFGCGAMPTAERAAGAALRYVKDTQREEPRHLTSLRRYDPDLVLRIDPATERNLELVRTIRDERREGTLLHLLDETETALGGRRLRDWLLAPLQERQAIESRLDAVEELLRDRKGRGVLRAELQGVQDLERLLARATLGRATARDLAAIRASLRRLPAVRAAVSEARSEFLKEVCSRLDPMTDLCELLEQGLVEEPPLGMKDGGLIRDGYCEELDDLRAAARGGKGFLSEIEAREREATGITSLKVRFNKVFGYFIEVSKPNLDRVPEHYVRRQTLVNAERFTTQELKEIEEKVLGAEERTAELEYRLFAELREAVSSRAARLRATSSAIAALDALGALAEVAEKRAYARPVLSEEPGIRIAGGRHPVVETLLREERFVPNDTNLDPERRQVVILTGPNMGGKSTYLRQVALITLMAHMGSFVPAEEAEIGIVDRIFTRVGASDSLAAGQSTFLVEMLETANILHNATSRSLVILDEVGRGTSTFDGLSLAWAVAEELHENERLRSMTLFATHYHELTDLARTLPRVQNLRVAVREWEDRIVFLRKVEEGTADKSYGIHVAKLAAIPESVLRRAREVLHNLEELELDPKGKPRLAAGREESAGPSPQLPLFAPEPHPALDEIRELDLDQMSPLDALNYLASLRRRLDEDR